VLWPRIQREIIILHSAFAFSTLRSAPCVQHPAFSTNVLVNSNVNYNTSARVFALANNTTGDQNTALGTATLFKNTCSSNNTAIGSYALSNNTTGSNNTCTGNNTLYFNSTGNNTRFIVPKKNYQILSNTINPINMFGQS
jgi:hypothetical protein